MSPSPHTIERGAALSEAQRIMDVFRIRHLPVLDDGRVCGILSQREVEIVFGFVSGQTHRVTVEDVMMPEPFVVSPEAPLDEVAAVMARRRIGSAVVVDQGHLVGVFTAVDALVALAEILRPLGSEA